MPDFKVDFALLLYDEFDGAPITDANVIFRHEDRSITPLRKREGFYVFRGLGLPEVEVEIDRPHYHKKIKRVIKSCLDPGNPVERVRLTRTFPGAFSDCEWIHGSCPPNTEVLAFSEEELKLQIGEEKNRLTVLGGAAGGLLGRRFLLDKKSACSFLLTRILSPGVYLSDTTLPASSKTIYPVIKAYLSKSGADGRYHIPVEHGHKGKIAGTAYYDRGKDKWAFVSVTARN